MACDMRRRPFLVGVRRCQSRRYYADYLRDRQIEASSKLVAVACSRPRSSCIKQRARDRRLVQAVEQTERCTLSAMQTIDAS